MPRIVYTRPGRSILGYIQSFVKQMCLAHVSNLVAVLKWCETTIKQELHLERDTDL